MLIAGQLSELAITVEKRVTFEMNGSHILKPYLLNMFQDYAAILK